MAGLPWALRAAIERLRAERGNGRLAQRSQEISAKYRANTPSVHAIGDAEDALAYAVSRLPATYAAVAKVLEELQRRAPDFQPGEMLDAGAGPGTAAWAATEAWPALSGLLLTDHNRQFLDLAKGLATESGREVLTSAALLAADIVRLDFAGRQFDLVTCGYALTEMGDSQVQVAAERLWAHCRGALVVVEPGRPRDYQRLMVVRERLIALGARVVAPCPHDAACPLVAPDWCHFSVRLDRSRDLMRAKGATLGFEDEKFSYLIVAREGVGATAEGRVIKPAAETKFSVALQVCAPQGLQSRVATSRNKPAFKAAKKLGWGDAVGEEFTRTETDSPAQ